MTTTKNSEHSAVKSAVKPAVALSKNNPRGEFRKVSLLSFDLSAFLKPIHAKTNPSSAHSSSDTLSDPRSSLVQKSPEPVRLKTVNVKTFSHSAFPHSAALKTTVSKTAYSKMSSLSFRLNLKMISGSRPLSRLMSGPSSRPLSGTLFRSLSGSSPRPLSGTLFHSLSGSSTRSLSDFQSELLKKCQQPARLKSGQLKNCLLKTFSSSAYVKTAAVSETAYLKTGPLPYHLNLKKIPVSRPLSGPSSRSLSVPQSATVLELPNQAHLKNACLKNPRCNNVPTWISQNNISFVRVPLKKVLLRLTYLKAAQRSDSKNPELLKKLAMLMTPAANTHFPPES
ncbi:hypothetical protein [Succinimonas sp.]|uniref:hypothetical protein n=1 Tax=Succinimonas sp. TaxID=1936151 RepID=UPI00386839E0